MRESDLSPLITLNHNCYFKGTNYNKKRVLPWVSSQTSRPSLQMEARPLPIILLLHTRLAIKLMQDSSHIPILSKKM
jgi:hypothetical protein